MADRRRPAQLRPPAQDAHSLIPVPRWTEHAPAGKLSGAEAHPVHRVGATRAPTGERLRAGTVSTLTECRGQVAAHLSLAAVMSHAGRMRAARRLGVTTVACAALLAGCTGEPAAPSTAGSPSERPSCPPDTVEEPLVFESCIRDLFPADPQQVTLIGPHRPVPVGEAFTVQVAAECQVLDVALLVELGSGAPQRHKVKLAPASPPLHSGLYRFTASAVMPRTARPGHVRMQAESACGRVEDGGSAVIAVPVETQAG